MKKVKLGIIGTGLAAKNLHLPALKELHTKFKITAVCNHTEPKAKKFSELTGGVTYVFDHKELLKMDDVDTVVIAVPIHLTYKITKDALKAGKNVIVEKPLGTGLRQAKQMLELDEKYKHKKILAENFRYRKVYEQAKKYINDGKIGKPYSLSWNVFTEVTPENNEYGATLWRQKPKHTGGFILDGGVHNIAAVRNILGDFKFGNALSKTINPTLGKPDCLSFHFQLKNGVMGLLNLFFTVKAHSEDRLLIFGDKGSIEILTDVLILKQDGKKDSVESFDDGKGFVTEFKDFYDILVKGNKNKSTFKEAYRDMEIIIGAINSAKNNRKVNF